ncbi:GGDEF domain-containing protein [Aquibium sp. ELW1220]|uniref:GGDEF domain-containing protein n=1 Tax=Aquibium sp. ELW1220 TaxID=2976766 RepID=UPI0025B00AFD|nr:GGDEF domain-containing protein [Aquibium sp. ELW1220]MDN2581583.1 GGDEF domain-containing protein [Aquibium sp. ELW1220]
MNIIRRRFLVRIMVTCFIGIHVPLIAVVVLHMWTGDRFDWTVIGSVLAATLIGTAATLHLLRREMTPVIRIARALESFAERREIMPIDHAAPDEIGRLARSAAWAIETADRLLQETEREARTDGLTGLANRRAFLERAATESGGSIAILDIDCFKVINDTHGHPTGDHVLKTIAGLIRDVVGDAGCVARLGGEEFGVLLPASAPDEAVRLIERARATLAAASVLDDRSISFSAGVAGRTADIAADMARADRAMYRAKNTGRNRVERAGDARERRFVEAPPLAADGTCDRDLAAKARSVQE